MVSGEKKTRRPPDLPGTRINEVVQLNAWYQGGDFSFRYYDHMNQPKEGTCTGPHDRNFLEGLIKNSVRLWADPPKRPSPAQK